MNIRQKITDMIGKEAWIEWRDGEGARHELKILAIDDKGEVQLQNILHQFQGRERYGHTIWAHVDEIVKVELAVWSSHRT